jgi:PAS domain S-box-containing protein
MFGYTWDELADRPLEILLGGPGTRPDLPGALSELLSGCAEHSCRRKDGSEFPAELSVTPLNTGDGRLFSVAIRDLDERHRATIMGHMLESVVRYSDDAIMSRTADGVVTSWNPGAQKLYGYRPQEIVGRPVSVLFPDHGLAQEADAFERIRRGELVHLRGVERVRKDGRRLLVDVTISPIADAGGHVVGAAAVSRASTQRSPAERTAARLLEAAAVAVLGVDGDGRVSEANPEATRLFGYRREELVGSPLDPLLPEDLRVRQSGALRDWLADPRPRVVGQQAPLRARRRDGTEFPAMVALSPAAARADGGDNGDGDGVRVVAVVHDLTARVEADVERARRERENQRTRRLESLGQLAGGVAHDFNNLLGIVLNHVDLLDEDLADPQQSAESRACMRQDLERMRKAVERGTRLTRQLLAFGRREVVRPQVLDVNAAAQRALAPALGQDVRLAVSTAPELWPAVADAGQLEQVLTALAMNAREAMPGGGLLAVETANRVLDRVESGSRGVAPGRYVSVRVTDSGGGMEPAVLEHAFDPFFTTKPDGGGRGLGLATVYGRLTEAGGAVYLESEVGRGTTATLLLPAAESEPAAPAEPASSAAGPAVPVDRPKTVLVVDDEPDLLHAVETMLSRAGYRVLAAGCGPDALELVSAHEGVVDLLLSDVSMPGMLGPEVAEEVRAIRPGIQVMFMSGHAQPFLASGGVEGPDVVLVEKPFTRDILLSRVAEVLGSSIAG